MAVARPGKDDDSAQVACSGEVWTAARGYVAVALPRAAGSLHGNHRAPGCCDDGPLDIHPDPDGQPLGDNLGDEHVSHAYVPPGMHWLAAELSNADSPASTPPSGPSRSSSTSPA